MFICITGCSKDYEILSSPGLSNDDLSFDQWYLTGTKGRQHILTNTLYKGEGVLIALVDDGLDIHHEDLKNNIGQGSYSYLSKDYNFSDASHGTACAGIMVAEENNDIGIRGIAPKAKIIVFNSNKTPDVEHTADALEREAKRVWVSNNSWGDFNSWGEPFALRKPIEDALEKGVSQGRYGRGIIYVFSAGNGNSYINNLPTDNVNYSGLVNNRYTIPVAAIDDKGKHIDYSEIGATIVVSAPSKSDKENGIVTLDVSGDLGYNPRLFKDDYTNKNYTRYFGGTSASAPMVSAISALMLEANPLLGWRDVRAILAQTASKNDPEDEDWAINGNNLHINHKYGFGIVNTDKAIEMSLFWQNFPDEIVVENTKTENAVIPDNDEKGIESIIQIKQKISIEFIDIFFDCPNHERLGDLEVTLISPSGTQSVLAQHHQTLFSGAFRYNNWRFGSMRHLGENSNGTWKLIVKDKSATFTGKLVSWRIKIYGH